MRGEKLKNVKSLMPLTLSQQLRNYAVGVLCPELSQLADQLEKDLYEYK